MMPAGRAGTTWARSLSNSPDARSLTRTQSFDRSGCAASQDCIMVRATGLRSGNTASSRSSTKASAPAADALASFLSLSAGTNSIERIMSIPLESLGTLHLQTAALALRHQFVFLIPGAVQEGHDAGIRSRFAFAQFQDLGFHVDRVAMKERGREPYLVPAEIGDRRAVCRFVDRNSHHETQSKGAVDDAVPEFGMFLTVLLIQVQIGRIMGETRKPDVIGFGDRAAGRSLEDLAHGKFIEIHSRHRSAPQSL